MVSKMRKPLMERVFRMIKNGIENEDSRALLELYSMLTWTVDGENWDYWELKRFDELRERYCPPNWGFGEVKEDEEAAAEGEETDTARTEE